MFHEQASQRETVFDLLEKILTGEPIEGQETTGTCFQAASRIAEMLRARAAGTDTSPEKMFRDAKYACFEKWKDGVRNDSTKQFQTCAGAEMVRQALIECAVAHAFATRDDAERRITLQDEGFSVSTSKRMLGLIMNAEWQVRPRASAPAR